MYQHPRHELVHDTALGVERSDDVVLVQFASRPRERAMAEAFYSRLCCWCWAVALVTGVWFSG